MQYIFDYETSKYLLILNEVDRKERPVDIFKVYHSQEEDDFTEYELDIYKLEGEEGIPIRMKELPSEIRATIGDDIINVLPKTFVANPYFDEMMIFFGDSIYTSQDKLKPINCSQCGKMNLYEKRDKSNKSDFIKKIQGFLQVQGNEEWPFKENLLVQFTVSDKESKLKKIDLDNIAKTLFDAFQGTVYLNDSQIVGFAADKYSIKGLKAFIVAIRRLSPREKPLYQEFLFSGKQNQWKEQYEEKKKLNKPTRFIRYS